jgi:putative phosphoesterase
LKTVAVIADTHLPRGSRRLPDACVERLRAADLVIHAGDFSAQQAFEEIASLSRRLVAVHGNVDEAALRRRLPERTEVQVGGVRIAVIHDAGARQGRLRRMRRLFPGADAVVFGHSHMPLLERGEDGFQIFNPGSPTERRRAPARTMGIARLDGHGAEFEHIELP